MPFHAKSYDNVALCKGKSRSLKRKHYSGRKGQFDGVIVTGRLTSATQMLSFRYAHRKMPAVLQQKATKINSLRPAVTSARPRGSEVVFGNNGKRPRPNRGR